MTRTLREVSLLLISLLFLSGLTSCGSSTPTVVAYALTVVLAGTGSGSITSSPAGINCAPACLGEFGGNTSVTLTAAPGVGATFGGWSGGGCSGIGTCVVTVVAATSVAATFNPPGAQYSLVVTKAGAGTGTVTSSVGGINCGATCSAVYNSGTAVTLTAAAAAGSTFTGWSGSRCTGTGTCVVTVVAANNVTATFTSP